MCFLEYVPVSLCAQQFLSNFLTDVDHCRQISFGVDLDFLYGEVCRQRRASLMVWTFTGILDFLLDLFLLLLYYYGLVSARESVQKLPSTFMTLGIPTACI